MTKAKKTRGVFSMTADDVSWLANWTLIAALLVGVAATYAIVISGNVKEAALKRDLAQAGSAAASAAERASALEADAAKARERTAALEKEAEAAKAAIATADARAAEATQKAAEAQLALEQFKAPRPMSTKLEQQLKDTVVQLIPQDRPPAVGAMPATLYNLQFAEWIASILGIQFNQGAVEANVGPARGVVAVYITLNERGKRLAEAFAAVLNENGISASAEPGLMERLFHPIPNNPNFKPMDPTEPGQSWVVIVVGDKP
jgi:hypothetical protein